MGMVASSEDPLVSVVVPTYNRSGLVGRAIRSVLAQSFQDWEMLVIDDASEDDTEEVVAGFSDSRIRYIQHATNQGGSAARNTGIREARGTYIAFLDSDDTWLPSKLELQVKAFSKSDTSVGLIYTGMIHKHENGESSKYPPRFRGNLTHNLLTRNVIGSTSTAIIRGDVFERVGGFDPGLPARQDVDLWLRIACCYRIDFVDECLTIIHKEQRPDRLSLNGWGRCKGYVSFYNKHRSMIHSEGTGYRYLCQMGRVFDIHSDKVRVARTCYIRSLVEKPTFLRVYPLYLMTYVPEIVERIMLKMRSFFSSDAHRNRRR